MTDSYDQTQPLSGQTALVEDGRVLAGTRGHLPGEDPREALISLRGELGHPHWGCLPVLDDRGFASTTLARTITGLDELYADGQPFGWRLTTRPSTESRAAASRWRSDVNLMADLIGGEGRAHRGQWVVEITGPITLATELKLSNGEAVLSDHGARRDLAASQRAGITDMVADLRLALDSEPLALRIVEPRMCCALNGEIPTSSGLRTYRSLPKAEAHQRLHELAETISAFGVRTILDTGGPVPPREAAVAYDAISTRPRGEGAQTWEALAGAVERGQDLWLGVVPVSSEESVPETVGKLWGTWRDLGFGAKELAGVVITESESLMRVSPERAIRALSRNAQVAEGLHETSRE